MYGYDIFHEDLMNSLITAVREGISSHAYIFEGDRGLDVESAARLFAAALTCANSEIAPCGACPSCVEAKAGTNPDIIYVTPYSDRKTIGTKNMRALEGDAGIKPFAAKRKVYVFPDASLVTEPAQNVLLKTLEEPPEYAAFILVTENADTLLETIRSRSVIVHFPAVSESAVRKYIAEKYPEENDRLDFLAKYCAGIPKRADDIIADEGFEPLRKSALDNLPLLLGRRGADVFKLQGYVDENKDDFARILDFWTSFLRDVLLLQTGADDGIINVDKRDSLRRICAAHDPQRVVATLDALTTAQKMTARYVNPKAVTYWLAL